MKKIVFVAAMLLMANGGDKTAIAEWEVKTRSQNSTVIGTIVFQTFEDFEKMFPEEARLAEELVVDAMRPEEIGFYTYTECGKFQLEFSSKCHTDMECVETYPFLGFSLESINK